MCGLHRPLQGQPLGIEQLADVLAGLQHDLVDIFRVVNPVRRHQ